MNQVINAEKKLIQILKILKMSPMPYSTLKNLSGYRIKKEHREFPELMKLGLRLHLINLDRYSREYELTPYSTRIIE
ncbi:MAG: hypothetical protein HOB51_02405 [Thaumarchaeota archaeon]|jgi:hypothetical protein|nr:hypothetical protein [Nitrososphaerota archaeon]|tara:strand:- start:92 stop:322 length:231 start_codon:yes stop_codon:yes gene_type:complete